MIKFFEDIAKKELSTAGGKGASLSRMAKAGLNIPKGFVVGADEFFDFLKINKNDLKIDKLLNACQIDNVDNLEKTSSQIKKIILHTKMPADLQKSIVAKFDALGIEFVAVRSSATVEDGKTNAWAGQLDSFLFTDKKCLIENIKKCWASLFGARAIYYRIKNNFKQNIGVAVVVQQMINSEFSGIAFSKDPSGKDGAIVECVEGLGEAIVSGSVTPDRYIVTKGNKIEVKIANQTKKLVYNKNKTEYAECKNDSQKLSNKTILNLVQEIKKIKAFYGFEVDVEWAINNNDLYILQCRPITTFVNSKIANFSSQILKSDNWEFYVSRPFHWLLESTQILGGSEKEQNKYLGFNIALQNYLILNGDEYFSVNEDDKNKKILKDLLVKNPKFFDDYAETLFKIVKDNLDFEDELKNTTYSKLTDKQLLKLFKKFKNNYIKSVVPTFARPDFFLESEFSTMLKNNGFSEKDCEQIFKMVATCSNDYGSLFYTEEPLDLLKIALEKQKGKNIDQMLKNHVTTYAWLKAPVQEEITQFTLADYEKRIDNLLNENIEEKISNVINARKSNDDMFDMAVKKYNLKGKTLHMARTLRTFIFLRTYMTEHTDHLFFTARKSLLKEICKRFKIKDQDLVMLSLDEIQKFLGGKINKSDIAKLQKERRKGFAIVWLNKKYKVLFGEDAVELQSLIAKSLRTVEDKQDKSNKIVGDVANKGKVVGIARILNSYEDIYKVEKGDIIVASMTTPDYISAMEKAIGFITDEGGITCHAAIISREFNLPCIVGTVNATKLIKDGAKIELNAFTGEVTILD